MPRHFKISFPNSAEFSINSRHSSRDSSLLGNNVTYSGLITDEIKVTINSQFKMSFCYFAYGSNLLKKRIKINNPTAELVDIGRLNNHCLDFSNYSGNWRGAVATIVPTEGTHIWGAIWKLSNEYMPALDKQEGVESKTYFPKTVIVSTPNDCNIECRTYQLTELPPPSNHNEQDLPVARRPSITYIDCIIKGAIESKLPKEYIEKLKKIPNNGQEATPELREQLGF